VIHQVALDVLPEEIMGEFDDETEQSSAVVDSR
jgi:hypothetical protein